MRACEVLTMFKNRLKRLRDIQHSCCCPLLVLLLAVSHAADAWYLLYESGPLCSESENMFIGPCIILIVE